MAKGIYLGIDSLSRKVKKMYLGIEGVARKVKKGYVGVNGIARLFFSGVGKPQYFGGYDFGVETAGSSLSAVANDKYALFVYKVSTSDSSQMLLAVDEDLTAQAQNFNSHLTCDHASNPNVAGSGAGSFGEYAILAYYDAAAISRVFYDTFIDTDLMISRQTIRVADSITIGDTDWTAGGVVNNLYSIFRRFTKGGYKFTYYWDKDLLATVLESMWYDRGTAYEATGVSGEKYAYILGGEENLGEIDCYDADFLLTTVNDKTSRYRVGGAMIGKYAVFGGGYRSTGSTNKFLGTICYLDEDLVLSELPDLDPARDSVLGLTFLEGYGAMNGGRKANNAGSIPYAELYDKDLLKLDNIEFPDVADETGARVGNYMICAPGLVGTGWTPDGLFQVIEQ